MRPAPTSAVIREPLFRLPLLSAARMHGAGHQVRHAAGRLQRHAGGRQRPVAGIRHHLRHPAQRGPARCRRRPHRHHRRLKGAPYVGCVSIGCCSPGQVQSWPGRGAAVDLVRALIGVGHQVPQLGELGWRYCCGHRLRCASTGTALRVAAVQLLARFGNGHSLLVRLLVQQFFVLLKAQYAFESRRALLPFPEQNCGIDLGIEPLTVRVLD